MKVCIISNFWPPEQRGGGQDVAVMTAHGFRDLGHEVIVITMQPYSGLSSLRPAVSHEEGLKVYRWFPINFYYLGNAARRSLIVRILWNIWEAFNLPAFVVASSILHKEKPDMIISHNVKGLGGFIYRAAVRCTKNYIHVLHDVVLIEPSGLVFPATLKTLTNIAHRIYALITRGQTKIIPFVVAPSSWLLNLHLQQGFFRQAVTQTLFNPVTINTNIKQPHSDFNVLFLGQLETHKGIVDLLSAWSLIGVQNKKLTVVGDGSLQAIVERACQMDPSIQRVEMSDWLIESRQAEIWAATDLVVVPSKCLENAPTVISQALGRGLKVVASNGGGIPELVKLSPNLQIVEIDESGNLAGAIIASINSELSAAIAFYTPREYAEQLSAIARKQK